jgi:hypothetical protein
LIKKSRTFSVLCGLMSQSVSRRVNLKPSLQILRLSRELLDLVQRALLLVVDGDDRLELRG